MWFRQGGFVNILVISDLHICNGDEFGTFGWKADEFIAQLEKIKTDLHVEKVFLNGDIYELMKYSFKEIAEANPKLIEYFNRSEFIYIKGNHDVICESGEDFFLIENSEGKSILIEHGHNADFLNGTLLGRFIGNLGSIF